MEPDRSRLIKDVCVVASVPVLLFVIAARLELGEAFARWIGRHERWQADELILASAGLALAAVWFAARRWRDARVELSQRRRAEERVSELLRHNRELSHRLMDAQEGERRALARELHDELGQRCNAICVEAKLMERGAAADPQAVAAGARRIAEAADNLYGLVRDLLRRLRPTGLDELGLVGATQALCEGWEERSGVACVMHASGDLDDLGEAVNIAVYRTVQEALNNVLKHAGAGRVTVRMQRLAGALRLEVEDDGRGFDPDRATDGLGLLGIRERASALGGQLRVDSEPDRGARIELLLPLDSPAS